MNKNNIIYIYNGNFLSLLGLIIILIRKRIIPKDIKPINYNFGLFDEYEEIDIPEKEETIGYVIKNIGYNNFNIIFKTYLADAENKEIAIFYFFLYSLKYKDKTIFMRNNYWIRFSLKMSEYVSRENHKFKGFTRFRKMENDIYYAEINPTNNILFLLSIHFKNRLSGEYWIIKDDIRKIYSIYDKKKFIIVSEDEFKIKDFKFSLDEIEISNLWKDFYKTIGIKERNNDRCRMNFMPKKYWKYIIEMSDDDEKSD